MAADTEWLVGSVPGDVRAELDFAAATLGRLVPLVVAVLRRIHPLTGAVEDAMGWSVDGSVSQLVSDADAAPVMDRLGITALWRLADQLADAHPDRAGAGGHR